MKELIQLAKCAAHSNNLPFSVYSSVREQCVSNVPVIKPLLIVVLEGVKQLGRDRKIECPAGTFVFLSNSPTVDMRNIPEGKTYLAVLIEFEYADFDQFERKLGVSKTHFQGCINPILEKSLQHYMDWSAVAPPAALHLRRKELLQVLYLSGYEEVGAIAEPPSLSHQIYTLISSDITDDWSVERLSEQMSMSESTLRRRLKAEGTNVQAIRSQIKLGYGLHLIQTTTEHVGRISERCGYQSQSRFTDQFKQMFGMTPSELRRTRVRDQGEKLPV